MVTTRVGATPEFFVDNESCIFVDVGNPTQIVAAVETVLSSKTVRERLGTGARQVFSRRLSRDRIMESMEASTKRFCGRRAALLGTKAADR